MGNTHGMAFERIPLHDCHIGYIVRGRPSFGKVTIPLPLEDPIHADCILPNGGLAGYAYDDESYYNGNRINQYKLKGLEGKITCDEEVAPYYRNIEKAIKFNVLSSFLVVEVAPKVARAFFSYWEDLTSKMPKYNRALNNCSTICYSAFKQVGLLPYLFPPITPVRLHGALLKEFLGKRSYNLIDRTGYFGVEKDRKMSNIIVAPHQ